MKKTVICLFFAVFLSGVFCACQMQEKASPETEEQGTEIAKESEIMEALETTEVLENIETLIEADMVASFVTEESAGSCIVLSAKDNHLLVATASHVAGKTDVILLNGTEATVMDYWKSSDFDLVYLWVETKETLSLEKAFPSVKAFNELQEGSKISVVGAVAGEKVCREGTVRNCFVFMEDFGYHMLWGDVAGVKGGMSGGGVFDSRGRLIGMLCGGDGDREIAVLPISIMSAEWKNSDLEQTIDIFTD